MKTPQQPPNNTPKHRSNGLRSLLEDEGDHVTLPKKSPPPEKDSSSQYRYASRKDTPEHRDPITNAPLTEEELWDEDWDENEWEWEWEEVDLSPEELHEKYPHLYNAKGFRYANPDDIPLRRDPVTNAPLSSEEEEEEEEGEEEKRKFRYGSKENTPKRRCPITNIPLDEDGNPIQLFDGEEAPKVKKKSNHYIPPPPRHSHYTFVETRGSVPERIGNKNFLGRWLYLIEDEKQQEQVQFSVYFLFSILSIAIMYHVFLHPPIQNYQGENATYRVNRIFRTVSTSHQVKYHYTSQNMNGIYYFTVENEDKERLFAFNSYYGAKQIDVNGQREMTVEQLDLYHALMRIEPDFRYIAGTEYEYTGSYKSTLIHGYKTESMIYFFLTPHLILSYIHFFRPDIIVDISIWTNISRTQYYQSSRYQKRVRNRGIYYFFTMVLLYFVFPF